MADPVLAISAASSLGRNYATLNATLTSNGTLRTWWAGEDQADKSDITESLSDTEYYFEFVSGDTGSGPIVLPTPTQAAYVNVTDYPPPTTPVLAVSTDDPITITEIAYMLISGQTYNVRLCVRVYQYPGAGNGERYKRSNQPYKLFFTDPVEFTLPD